MGERNEKGIARKSMVVKVWGKCEVLAPRKLSPLVIQMRAVGGERELPRRWYEVKSSGWREKVSGKARERAQARGDIQCGWPL